MADRRTLEIGIEVDNSQSIAANQQQVESFAQVDQSAQRSANKVQAASDRSAARIIANQEKILAATQRSADRQAAAEERRYLKALVAAEGMRQKDIEKAMAASERQIAIGQRQAEAEERRAERTVQQNEAKQQRIIAAAMRDSERQIALGQRLAERKARIEAKEEAERKARRRKEMMDAEAAAQQSSDKISGYIKTVVGSGLGLGAVRSFALSYSAALREGAKEAQDLAKFSLDLREAIKDIIALRGGSGSKDSDLAKFSALRVESGLNQQAAHDFTMDFESSVATATDENMTPQEKAKLAIKAAKFAARTTTSAAGSASTAQLAGTLARFQRGGTAEGTVAQMDRLNSVFSLGDGSNDAQRDQLNKVLTVLVSPDGKGLAANPLEAAAMTAMASTTGPVDQAGTTVLQAMRALRSNKTGIDGGRTMSPATFRKSLGINEHDTILQSLNKLMPEIAKQEVAGRAPDAFLAEIYESEEERLALVKFYNAFKAGTAGKILAESGKGLDVAGTNRREKTYLNSKEGRRNVLNAREDQIKATHGMLTDEAELRRKEAELELKATGEWYTNQGYYHTVGLANGYFSNPTEGGQKLAIDAKVIELAKKRGINIPLQTGNWFERSSGMGRLAAIENGERDMQISDAYNGARMNGPIPLAGQEAMGVNQQTAKQMLDEQKKTNQHLQNLAGKPNFIPVPRGGRAERQN